jgi:hypothetical protein
MEAGMDVFRPEELTLDVVARPPAWNFDAAGRCEKPRETLSPVEGRRMHTYLGRGDLMEMRSGLWDMHRGNRTSAAGVMLAVRPAAARGQLVDLCRPRRHISPSWPSLGVSHSLFPAMLSGVRRMRNFVVSEGLLIFFHQWKN